MSICRYITVLACLEDGSLSEAAMESLANHVEGCDDCRRELQRRVEVAREGPARPPEPAELPDLPGYEIQEEIGRGGMGVVYRAWNFVLAKPVAIKFLPSGPFSGDRERKRWLAEARSWIRVKHAGVVGILEASESGGWLYLVLEWVPGGSLRQRLAGPIAPRAAAGLIKAIGEAVVAIHDAGVLHLDLKPANILLHSPRETPWDRANPKVADFGIARQLDGLDSASISRLGPWGTPAYMAPEQVAGRASEIGTWTDVHSLGTLLYELLTGRPPYLAPEIVEVFDRVREQEPVPPRKLVPTIPRDLETICLCCLDKDPRRRYRDAAAFTEEVARFLENRPIHARRVSFLGRAWRASRRQPIVACLLATLVLLGVAFGAGWLILSKDARAERLRAERERRSAQDQQWFSASAVNPLGDYLAPEGPELNFKESPDVLELLRESRDYILQQRRRAKIWPLALHTVEAKIASALVARSAMSDAREILDMSIVDFERLVRYHGKEDRYKLDLAALYLDRANVAQWEGRGPDALVEYQRVRQLFDENQIYCTPFHVGSNLYSRIHQLGLDEFEPNLRVEVGECLDRIVFRFNRTPTPIPGLAGFDGPEPPQVRAIAQIIQECADNIDRTQKHPKTDRWVLTAQLWLAIFIDQVLEPAALPGQVEHPRSTYPERLNRLVQILQAWDREPPVPWAMIEDAMLTNVRWRCERGTILRKQGRFDQAETLANKLMAIGCSLAGQFPDRAIGHMVLMEAHSQAAKMALIRRDMPLALKMRRGAIEECRRANEVNPMYDPAHRILARLTVKLQETVREAATQGSH